MTAVNETDSSLTTKCLDFCQALASQGKDFKFAITVGSTFSFSLDTREGRETLPTRSKKSPSTQKRNAKRRKEFLIKKSTSESTSATGLEPNQKSKKQGKGFQCDQCDLDFKTENGLKIHKGKSHKEVSSPEKKRRSSSKSSLILSPIRDQSRVEPCHNCGMEMSPAHQCQHDQDFTLNEKTEVEASPTCPGHPTYGPCGCTKWNQPCLYRTPDFMWQSVQKLVTYRPTMARLVNF